MKFQQLGSFFLLITISVEVENSVNVSETKQAIPKNVENSCLPKTIGCDAGQCIRIQHKCKGSNWDSDLRYRVLILVYTEAACRNQEFKSPILFYEFEKFVDKKNIFYGELPSGADTSTEEHKKPYECNSNNNCTNKFDYKGFGCSYDSSLNKIFISYKNPSKLLPISMSVPKKKNYRVSILHSGLLAKVESKNTSLASFNSIPNTCSPKTIKCDNNQCIKLQHKCHGNSWNSHLDSKVLMLLYSAAACKAQNFTKYVAVAEFRNFNSGIVHILESDLNTNGDIPKWQMHPYKCHEKNNCGYGLDYRDFKCYHEDNTIKILYQGENKQFLFSKWMFSSKTVVSTHYSKTIWKHPKPYSQFTF